MSVFLNYRAPISVYTYLSGTELPRTYLNLKPAQKGTYFRNSKTFLSFNFIFIKHIKLSFVLEKSGIDFQAIFSFLLQTLN